MRSVSSWPSNAPSLELRLQREGLLERPFGLATPATSAKVRTSVCGAGPRLTNRVGVRARWRLCDRFG